MQSIYNNDTGRFDLKKNPPQNLVGLSQSTANNICDDMMMIDGGAGNFYDNWWW